MNLVEKFHAIPVLYPVANALAGTVNTDIVECLGDGVLFELTIGNEAAGTATHTITVRASDDNAATTTAAVDFVYRISTTPDTWSAWTTTALAAGFVTTAGDNQMYQIYVPAEELATLGYGYVYLRSVEVVADAAVAGINAYIVNPSYVVQPESLLD